MDIALRVVESFPEEFSEGGVTYKRTPGAQIRYDDAVTRAKNMIVVEHGRVDAIILQTDTNPPPMINEFRVYISRNGGKGLSGAESEHIGYDITSNARRQHIQCMFDAGQRGISDMSTHSSQYVLPPDGKTLKLTADDISPDHDIIGFDHPRTDIHIGKTRAGTTIRTGGNSPHDQELLSSVAADVLNTNFSDDEVREMNLYFEGSALLPMNVAGTCSTHRGGGEPVSIVSVPAWEADEGVMTHELVHALRAMDGRKVNDRDSEEIETEYETTLRVQNPQGDRHGYYAFVPGVAQERGRIDPSVVQAAMFEDRVLATGATDKPLKGRRLTHDVVPNTIKRSRIETARASLDLGEFLGGPRTGEHSLRCQMIAEDVDTYFQIKLPDKSTVEYHIRFDGARPPLKEIKKHLRSKFGKNIEAWEWQDGRRVRLISRPKKRTAKKRTTKKRTPAKRKTPVKRRTPKRKPVAAERYGLDAILGVPEGIL